MKRVALPGLVIVTVVALAVPAQAAGLAAGTVRTSGPSPFTPGCSAAVDATSVNYLNAEVEPFLAANPARPANLVAVWQQDRWNDGGANGLLARRSVDGGRTWQDTVNPPFSHCAGGNARNGGDYERASDPWVTFAPNGDAYYISLSFNATNATNAILVSKSRDGGHQWGPIRTLIRDTDPTNFDDKESITADPTDPSRVYAVWDRSSRDANGGRHQPAFFARTTNGAASFEPARPIFDAGAGTSTIGNIINVLPDGTLIDSFDLNFGRGQRNVALVRSTDHGVTWDANPTFVDQHGTIGVVDPRDGTPVRTGDILPSFAVDPRPGHRNVYAVWQDARFSSGQADQIAFSQSRDGGLTWSPPVRISEPGPVQAFNPAISVDRDGRIAVSYYDFTFDTVASPALETDLWLTRSTDGGRTFTRRERITPSSFDMRAAPVVGARGFFIGDYTGLVDDRIIDAEYVATTGDPANLTDTFAGRTVAGPREAAPPQQQPQIVRPLLSGIPGPDTAH
jgi:hypothetical protein